MRFSTVVAAVAALAMPLASAQCLTQTEANTLAKNFGLLISNYSNALANETLTTNFQDYSESVNTLIDSAGSSPVSLLGQTFSSRAGFEAGSSAQPAVPFTVKNVWFTCDVITVRWLSAQTPEPVVGISVLHTVYEPKFSNVFRFQIDEVWAEFDSGAWLVNLGVFKPATKREISFSA